MKDGGLDLRQGVGEGLRESPVAPEVILAQRLEDLKDFVGGRGSALTLLGGERGGGQTARRHGAADLALDQGVEGDGEEVEEQEGLDALHALEVHRDDRGGGLELLMSLLDAGLILVGEQELGGG